MRNHASGFTLIELMIVIAIIAIIAAIAIPNLLSARLNSNETAAIATLRNIISAQAQFQTTARADENLNLVDADLAETTWAAYAWPVSYGSTGNRTFFVNQGGDILATDDSSYSGPNAAGAPMDASSAFAGSGPATTITGRVATGTVGRDGNFWKQVG